MRHGPSTILFQPADVFQRYVIIDDVNSVAASITLMQAFFKFFKIVLIGNESQQKKVSSSTLWLITIELFIL